jgi:hypothetical protein
MSRPDFPHVLDSTIIAAFRSCPERARMEFVEHWKPRAPSVHLVAGAAYAAGLEAARRAFYVEGQSKPDAEAIGAQALFHSYGDFQCPADSAKSVERTLGALEFYFSQYPLDKDNAIPLTLPSGAKAIEFSFAEPLDISHPQTGDPLLYCGRADSIMTFAGGTYIEDDKTTSQLGASWPRQWDLRSQFTGYCWGARKAGIKVDGVLVRGVSILKTKYDTLQAITYRPEWQIDRWYKQLHRDVERMIYSWQTGVWDFSLDHACTEYGGCIFRQICMSPPEGADTWLNAGFERRKWDPILRIETVLSAA